MDFSSWEAFCFRDALLPLVDGNEYNPPYTLQGVSLVIVSYIKNLAFGGAQKAAINLAIGFSRREGIQSVLVTNKMEGPFRSLVPPAVEVVEIGASRTRYAPSRLRRYLCSKKPDVILAHETMLSYITLHALRGESLVTRVVSVHHTPLGEFEGPGRTGWLSRLFVKHALSRAYRKLNSLNVCVSQAMRPDLCHFFGISEDRMSALGNASVDLRHSEPRIPAPHAWLKEKKTPVVVGVGSLTRTKRFSLLLESIAIANQTTPVRAIILGEGAERRALELQRDRLGLRDLVELPGWIENPFPFLQHADVFVLSSFFEALPTVIIEALAVGCPVVSVDVQGGPREILEDGKYGMLVKSGDAIQLAGAILKTAGDRPDGDLLKRRAEYYSIDTATSRYLEHFLKHGLISEYGPVADSQKA